jgi:hypothetical protein
MKRRLIKVWARRLAIALGCLFAGNAGAQSDQQIAMITKGTSAIVSAMSGPQAGQAVTLLSGFLFPANASQPDPIDYGRIAKIVADQVHAANVEKGAADLSGNVRGVDLYLNEKMGEWRRIRPTLSAADAKKFDYDTWMALTGYNNEQIDQLMVSATQDDVKHAAIGAYVMAVQLKMKAMAFENVLLPDPKAFNQLRNLSLSSKRYARNILRENRSNELVCEEEGDHWVLTDKGTLARYTQTSSSKLCESARSGVYTIAMCQYYGNKKPAFTGNRCFNLPTERQAYCTDDGGTMDPGLEPPVPFTHQHRPSQYSWIIRSDWEHDTVNNTWRSLGWSGSQEDCNVYLQLYRTKAVYLYFLQVSPTINALNTIVDAWPT